MRARAVPVLLHVFATFAVGGPQVRFAGLAKWLGQSYRHLVIAMDGHYDCTSRMAPGLMVEYPSVAIHKRSTIGNARRFRRMLSGFAPDILVTYNWGAIEWAMANIPLLAHHIHIEDGFGPEERTVQLRRRVLTRRLVLARSVVVLPSRSLLRIATEVWRLDPQRIYYIPNGVDLGRFAIANVRPIQSARLPLIGTVAALRAEKNLARLLRAFRMVVNAVPARLVIVGDGPERAALERQAQAIGLGEYVEFAGHVDEPAPMFAQLDVFALSSDTEQMPLSVIEAMAAGLPIAATDVGDIRAMVASENHGCITGLDDASLAQAMIALLRDSALREQIGIANRAKAAAEFDQAEMFRAYGALFDRIALPPVA